MDVRLWLASGQLVQGLTFAAIGLAIVILCSRLRRKEPFAVALSSVISVTAVAIAIGGILWQICFDVSGSLASQQVLGVTGWETNNSPIDGINLADFGWPGVGSIATVELWPIMIGLALGAVALLLRVGEGLQQETGRLKAETEGLV
jgi:hypothetical protein